MLVLDSVIIGVLAGSIYALMASGLTLIFGVMQIVNLAQGIFVVLGGYLSYEASSALHIDPFLSLLITMPVMFVLGVLIEWGAIRPLKGEHFTLSILATFSVALIIEGLLTYLLTPNYIQLHSWSAQTNFRLGDYYISYFSVFACVLSGILLGGLYLLLYRTKFGTAVRASMQNRTAATLIGINVPRVQALIFGIGTALAAAGGMAFGVDNLFNPASSYDLIYRLVVIIVIGGLGSLRGALAASLLMLVVEDFIAVVWSPTWSSFVFFVILLLVLRYRPQGLFGQLEGRKQ